MVAITPSQATTDYGQLATEIATWLRAQLDASGARGFVLGLSGGIDSAVVCALCTRAASPDLVLGAFMPSHSVPEDAACAEQVAQAFGVRKVDIDLTPVTDAFAVSMPADAVLAQKTGQAGIVGQAKLLADANIKPRMRMTALYYLANLTNSVVVGTGNKTEASIGYFTKYGDGGVDLLPIVDLYKFEVRALAQEVGVPRDVIERAPSAGLWSGQTDEKEIGLTYDQLDAALIAIAAGDESGIAPEVLARVKRMHTRSAHKRGTIPAFIRPA